MCVFQNSSGEQNDLGKFFGASRRPIPRARSSSNEHNRPSHWSASDDNDETHIFDSKLDKRLFFGSYLHLKNGSLNPRRDWLHCWHQPLPLDDWTQTDWHQDFTGTSVFYFLLKGRKELFMVEPTQKAQKSFDEWRESGWKRFVKRKTQFLLQFRLKIVIFFHIVKL